MAAAGSGRDRDHADLYLVQYRPWPNRCRSRPAALARRHRHLRFAPAGVVLAPLDELARGPVDRSRHIRAVRWRIAAQPAAPAGRDGRSRGPCRAGP